MKTITLFLLITLSSITVCAQLVSPNDTLYFNYSACDFPLSVEKNRGLIITNSNGTLKAKAVAYRARCQESNPETIAKYIEADNPSTLNIKIIEDNYIVNCYKQNNNNYDVIKEEWELSKQECDFLERTFAEIKLQRTNHDYITNVMEHYVIITNNTSFVYVDVDGCWNKYYEIDTALNIGQHTIRYNEKKNKFYIVSNNAELLIDSTAINSNLNISHNPIGKAELYFYSVPIEHDILKNSGISSNKDIRIKALYPCGIYLHTKIPIYANGLLLTKKSDKETFFDTMAMNGGSIKQLKKIDKDIAIKKYGKQCKHGVLLIVAK